MRTPKLAPRKWLKATLLDVSHHSLDAQPEALTTNRRQNSKSPKLLSNNNGFCCSMQLSIGLYTLFLTLALVGLSQNLYAQNVGIGTTNPTAKLHVDGPLRVGETTDTPASLGAGALRWNAALSRLEISDGSVWVPAQSDNLGDHTATTFLTMNDNRIRLRGDDNHALRYAGSGTEFDGLNVDGPALYGFNGGVLGSNQSGTESIALRWLANGNVGIGTTSPTATLHTNGSVRHDNLSGTGTRMVIADANGTLGTQAIPANTDNQTLSLSGADLTISNGNTITLPGDDLGNHTATQNLQTNGFWLSNDGDDEGIMIRDNGNAGIFNDTPQHPLHINEDGPAGSFSSPVNSDWNNYSVGSFFDASIGYQAFAWTKPIQFNASGDLNNLGVMIYSNSAVQNYNFSLSDGPNPATSNVLAFVSVSITTYPDGSSVWFDIPFSYPIIVDNSQNYYLHITTSGTPVNSEALGLRYALGTSGSIHRTYISTTTPPDLDNPSSLDLSAFTASTPYTDRDLVIRYDIAKTNAEFVVTGNGFVGVGTNAPAAQLHTIGSVRHENLGGSGNRMVVTDNNGNLTAQAIPAGDNLGDHTATTFLTMNDNRIRLRGDDNHALRYVGPGTEFNGQALDGPALYGWDGGVLGWKQGASEGTVLRWRSNGRVGIGTTNPQFPLHVDGAVASTQGYGFLNRTSPTGTCGSCTGNYSIYASDRVLAEEFNAFSDARIKAIRSRVTGEDALGDVLALQPTRYAHIDTMQKGTREKLGFIAQEVEGVVPEAVTQHADWVPDVYQLAEEVTHNGRHLSFKLPRKHDLQPGDSVQLILAQEKLGATVLAVSGNKLEAQLAAQPKAPVASAFVYGRWVEDFRVVDYDQLYTLGIGAIQQLDTQLEAAKAEIQTLKTQLEHKTDENSDLKAKQAQLESNQQQLFERLEQIEALVGQTAKTAPAHESTAKPSTRP